VWPGSKRRSGWRSTAPSVHMPTIPNGADRAETASSTTRTRSAWNIEAVEDHPDRPSLDSLRTTPERTKHILDGDSWGGGHRHGTGKPGKTEFPAGWEDDKIIGNVRDVARAPDDPPVFQPNHRWRVHGLRDGVGITVVVFPMGGSGQRGRTPAARVWSRTRRRNRERS
jgi:Bacterial EndoU nuclease